MPDFLITSPSGAKFKVTGPEGATEQDALAHVMAAEGATAPETTPPLDSPTTVPTAINASAVPPPSASIGSMADQASEGFLRDGLVPGSAAVLGAPMDILNNAPRLANLLPGEQGVQPILEKPLFGSAHIEEGLTSIADLLTGRTLGLNPDPGVPQNRPERFARSGGEVTGAAAPFIASLLTGAGATQTPKIVPGAKNLGAALDDIFLQPFRAAPAKTTATESVIATGAGLGKQLAEEVGAPPLVGELVGGAGAGGTLTAGRGIGRGAKEVVTPGTTKRLVGDKVGKTLEEASTRSIPENVQSITSTTQRAEEVLPGVDLTTGQAVSDPGVRGLEFQRRTGPNQGKFQQRESTQNAQIAEAIKTERPLGEGDQVTREVLEQRRSGVVQQVKQRSQEALNKVDASLQKLEPGVSKQEAGTQIRKEIDSALSEARASETELWGAIDNNQTLQTSTIKQKAQAILDDAARLEDPAATPDLIKDLAGDEGLLQNEETVTELLALKSRVQNDIREEIGGANNRNKIRKLNELVDSVMETLGGVPGSEEARAFSRELNDKFTRGPVSKTLAKDSKGELRVPDSAVPSQFIKKGDGSPEAIQAFENAVGDRDKAVEGLRQALLNDIKTNLVVDGKINARKAQQWVRQHEEVLNVYPELKRELGKTTQLQQTAAKLEQRQTLLAKKTQSPRDSVIARYLDAEEARDSMSDVLSSKRPQQEVKKLVNTLKGNEQALQGAQRAFYDLMVEGRTKSPKSGIQGVEDPITRINRIKPQAFKDFLNKNKEAAKSLFPDDPGHIDRLEDLADVLQTTTRTERSVVRGTSGTPQALKTPPGFTFAGFFSRTYGVARGVVSPAYVILETISRGVRNVVLKVKKEDFEALLDEALLDPELAKTLLIRTDKNNKKIIGRRLRTYLGDDIQNFLVEEDEVPEEAEPLDLR